MSKQTWIPKMKQGYTDLTKQPISYASTEIIPNSSLAIQIMIWQYCMNACTIIINYMTFVLH